MSLVGGAAIVLLGLYVAGLVRLSWLARDLRFATAPRPPEGGASTPTSFVMGLAFAFGWTPCIGPILATILALAATRESLGEGVALLALYAAGLGVPFFLTALGIGRFMAAAQKFRRHSVWVMRGAGALLVATGLAIASGRLQILGGVLLDLFPVLGRIG